jgi:FkbM family methyltransferase
MKAIKIHNCLKYSLLFQKYLLFSAILTLKFDCYGAKSAGGRGGQVKKSANAIVVPMGDDLCPGTHFKIQKKEINSFSDLSQMFTHYTLIPKLGGMTSHVVVVTVEVTGNKPCGAFTSNATFYFRAGLRDVKHFMYSYQSQAMGFLRSSIFKGSSASEQNLNILDLGARNGMTTTYMAMNFPKAKIIATEPSLPELALLRLNTAQYPNVYVEYGAVWDSQVALKLDRSHLIGRNRGSSADGRGRPGGTASSGSASQQPLLHRFVVDVMDVAAGAGKMGEVVPSITLSSLLQRHGWTEVDLLHADLDGGERVILGDSQAASTWLKKVRCISLRLGYGDQTAAVQEVGRMLGGAFLLGGRSVDVHYWCRQGEKNILKRGSSEKNAFKYLNSSVKG